MTVTDGTTDCTGTTGKEGFDLRGDMGLSAHVEAACAAAERWRETVAPKLRGMAVTCESAVMIGTEPGPPVAPGFTALRQASVTWLTNMDAFVIDGKLYDHRLVIALADNHGPSSGASG